MKVFIDALAIELQREFGVLRGPTPVLMHLRLKAKSIKRISRAFSKFDRVRVRVKVRVSARGRVTGPGMIHLGFEFRLW